MSRWALIAVLNVLLCHAQAEAPRLVASHADAAPRVDGRLNEAAWGRAYDATPFVLLGSNAPASQATTAWVLYDAENLYVGFECMEAQPEAMVELVTVRDGQTWLDDSVELFVAPRPTPQPYYHFVVNSLGVLRDEAGRDETWNSSATAAAAHTEDGWTAEVAVPLADLGITAASTDDWRINLCRDEKPHGETSSWAPTQQGFHEPARFGWLTDLQISVVRYARDNLLSELGRALDELHPSLERARAARPLPAAETAWQQGTAARNSFGAARSTADRPDATVRDLAEAEAQYDEGTVALAAMQSALPRMDMSIALRRQHVPTQYAVCQESSTARVRPDKPYAGPPVTELSVCLAANEYEATQLVVVPIEDELEGVEVEASGLEAKPGRTIPAHDVTVNPVGCVSITEPSARSGAQPGLYPDPLLERRPVDIGLSQTAAWLITVHAPPGRPAGRYAGEVTVAPANAPARTLRLVADIWDFELPTASALRTCFRLIPAYVWKYANLPGAPGVPPGWEFGVWTGADVEGREGYFGTGVFRSRTETSAPHSGRRAVAIQGEVAEPGTHEAPRACLHRVFPVTRNTDYALSVWYRTEGLADGGAQLHVHTHQVHRPLPASTEWAQLAVAFNSGDRDDCRVYLCNYGVGTVVYDDLVLAPAAHPDENLVDDPGFEQGAPFGKREDLLRAYRTNMLAHRCSDMDIAEPRIDIAGDGSVKIDWSEFDREIEFYIRRGLNAFNVGWARVPGGWGSVTGVDAQQLRISAEILRQTEAHLQDRGWLDMAYLYTIDEPGQAAFPDVKAAFRHVHEAAPRLKRLLTFGYGASRPIRPGNPLYRRLEGYVDIWVPHSDCFEPEYLEQRRRAGDEIWEYVCISAQKPYANIWGIDYPGIDPRVVFWQCYAEEITGFLYWATDYWEKDPWVDPLTYPGGNGDGSLVYYGEDGPVNSLRWETVRDGIEDYDYLALLASLVRRAEREGSAPGLCREAAALLDVSPVTRSYTDYTESPADLLAQRAAIAGAIERLARALGR